ncbi:hypothetical protein EVAR_31164_1 [Eumeta japonica]|uniref:Uncharacterized protein n=1 Tax=Eumeta variegata TaxID=151549 RepID=A0A4C1VWS8_EUMVA|nr:hypothetical protein EVAR_31164_1 [Eumeta japonica]
MVATEWSMNHRTPTTATALVQYEGLKVKGVRYETTRCLEKAVEWHKRNIIKKKWEHLGARHFGLLTIVNELLSIFGKAAGKSAAAMLECNDVIKSEYAIGLASAARVGSGRSSHAHRHHEWVHRDGFVIQLRFYNKSMNVSAASIGPPTSGDGEVSIKRN